MNNNDSTIARIKQLLPLIATIIAIAHGDVVDLSEVDCNKVANDSARGGITLLDDDWRVALAIYYATFQQAGKVQHYGGVFTHSLRGYRGIDFGEAGFERLVQMHAPRFHQPETT